LNRKKIIFTFVCLILIPTLFSTASAQTNRKDSAVGAGIFIHEHEGILHTHYFAFSVTTGPKNDLQGNFNLIRHDDQIDTIIVSTKITGFYISEVQSGLEAVFTGSAFVKLNSAAWQSGWTFIVTAYDSNGEGPDSIGITLLTPQGQIQCSADPTPISSGNIVVKT
jgi:hypothetical protein